MSKRCVRVFDRMLRLFGIDEKHAHLIPLDFSTIEHNCDVMLTLSGSVKEFVSS